MSGPAGQHPGDYHLGALLRLTAATEHLGSLDAREAAHYQEIADQLGEITETISAIKARGESLASAVADQAAILARLEGIEKRVAALIAQQDTSSAGDDDEDRPYRTGPSPHWWRLASDPSLAQQVRALLDAGAGSGASTGNEAAALAKDIRRLRDWATKVYLPGYGHLAAALGPCWDQHPLCLYTLDWLSELWQALYLTRRRTTATLAAQAEYQTRLLPAATAQMQAETNGCTQHSARPARSLPGRPGTTGAPA